MKTIPKELTEAALVDGARRGPQYWQIILPLCRPALAALATLEFTWIYNDFFWALVLMSSGDKRPITRALAEPAGQFFTDNNLTRRGDARDRAADDHGLRPPAAPVHRRPHARGDEGVAVTRIAFIGAGSVVFTKNLLGDILALPELRDIEIALHDIDAERLATAEAMAHATSREARGASPAITAHIDRTRRRSTAPTT